MKYVDLFCFMQTTIKNNSGTLILNYNIQYATFQIWVNLSYCQILIVMQCDICAVFKVITYVLITQRLSPEIQIIMEDERKYHSFNMTKNNKKLCIKSGNLQAKLYHLYII